MTENELLYAVRVLCRRYRLLPYHTFDSRRSEPGFPDVVLVGTRVLWRELKGERNGLTWAQAQWGRHLKAAGQDWAVWRPRDLRSGVIEREMASAVVSIEFMLAGG